MPTKDENGLGNVQRFADQAGGPALYAGIEYQTGVSLLEALGLLARQQQSPLTVLRLRCESRMLVPGGQFGFDLGVMTQEINRQIEMKSSPVKSDVIEIVVRLADAMEQGWQLQLVHGMVTKWTEALRLLIRNAGEAVDDEELAVIVHASHDVSRRELFETLLTRVGVGPRALLAQMVSPAFLPPAAVERLVRTNAFLLAGDGADELVRRLTMTLGEAFTTRRTLVLSDLHSELVDAALILRVAVVTPSADPLLARAIGVLNVCRAPLPEEVLAKALGLPTGGASARLAELIAVRVVLADGPFLSLPRTASPIPRSVAGSAVRDVLALLVDSPPETHLGKMAQVPNVLALADACLDDDPHLVGRSFLPYDKASKATGDLSSVYLLARTALDALTHADHGAERVERTLWLRAHARICGTSWTLQRVGQEVDASAEMDAARRESEPFRALDNLAFVEKCQGRLSRLLAEHHGEEGEPELAETMYQKSRAQLDAAHEQFVAMLADAQYTLRYAEEPGECLALRARTELSAGQLDEAQLFATSAHSELDGLGPQCKPWADTCLVEAELALARVREGLQTEVALELLEVHALRLCEVLTQFRDAADEPAAVDVGANEIVARTLQVLGQVVLETGDRERATGLLDDAARHFGRVDQVQAEYRCRAQALELQRALPEELLTALAKAEADPGCRVEAARLHLAEPRSGMPARHWENLVTLAAASAAAREHRWTDRAAG